MERPWLMPGALSHTVRKFFVSAGGGFLVDHDCLGVGVSGPGHEVGDGGSGLAVEGQPGSAKIIDLHGGSQLSWLLPRVGS